MKNMEELLRSVRLLEPSAALDGAMERLFAETRPAKPPLLKRPVALWQCVLACSVCALIALAVRPEREATTSPEVVTERAVYIFGATLPDRRAFDLLESNKDLPFADPSETRVIIGTEQAPLPAV